jgi:hypothetical protein
MALPSPQIITSGETKLNDQKSKRRASMYMPRNVVVECLILTLAMSCSAPDAQDGAPAASTQTFAPTSIASLDAGVTQTSAPTSIAALDEGATQTPATDSPAGRFWPASGQAATFPFDLYATYSDEPSGNAATRNLAMTNLYGLNPSQSVTISDKIGLRRIFLETVDGDRYSGSPFYSFGGNHSGLRDIMPDALTYGSDPIPAGTTMQLGLVGLYFNYPETERPWRVILETEPNVHLIFDLANPAAPFAESLTPPASLGVDSWEVYSATGVYSFRYPAELYVIRSENKLEASWPGVIILEPRESFNIKEPLAQTYRVSIAIHPNDQGFDPAYNAIELLSSGGILLRYDSQLLDGANRIQDHSIGGMPAWRVDELPVGQAGVASQIMAVRNGLIYEWVIEPVQTSGGTRNRYLLEEILATFTIEP